MRAYVFHLKIWKYGFNANMGIISFIKFKDKEEQTFLCLYKLKIGIHKYRYIWWSIISQINVCWSLLDSGFIGNYSTCFYFYIKQTIKFDWCVIFNKLKWVTQNLSCLWVFVCNTSICVILKNFKLKSSALIYSSQYFPEVIDV